MYLVEYINGDKGLTVIASGFYFSNNYEYVIFTDKKKPKSVIKMSDVSTILSVPYEPENIKKVLDVLKEKNVKR